MQEMKSERGARNLAHWLLGAILVIQVLLLAIAMGAPTPLAKYKYRVVFIEDGTFEETMASWGDKGWELVSARRASDSEKEFGYEVILRGRGANN